MFQPNNSLGPYKLLQQLGNGQFGVVWKAQKQEGRSPPCALKLPLDPNIKWEDVQKEACVWSKATGHPNVVPLIEANQYGGHIVLVSEYVEGGSLLSWLRQSGGKAPSLAKAIEIMTGVLAGLEYLHQRQIIHRDLKPANILLQSGIPRLADFGLSRVLSSQGSGSLAGTLAYMAPEAFDSSHERTVQSDVWAAGVILYELLSGRLPFPQQGQGPLMKAIFNDPPAPLPSDVPEPLRAIVRCALEKKLEKRYKTAAAMREALLHVNLTPQPQPPPGLLGQEKRMTAQAVLADLPAVLEEIVQRHTVFIIEIDDPGRRGDQEFVLAPEAVGKRVLGLVDEEYGWPKKVEVEQVRVINDIAPASRYHPFVQRDNQCVAVGISLWEYEKIKQRI
jgi:serine/threonine-protein kinase